MPSYTPDSCPDLSIQKSDVEFAKNLADWLVPSGRDRPRPEQQVVSLSEYNALLGEFEHMKNTANKAIEKCEYIAADRDAAYNTIGKLRREYKLPLTPDDLKKIVDTEFDSILEQRGMSKEFPS